MKRAPIPPMTSVDGALSCWMASETSASPVTSMTRSTPASAINSLKSVVTRTLSRRASSIPGAQGFRSAIPTMATVGSPANISSKARPPLPAPTMTTFVTA